jgi:hypothetical protein
MKGKEKNHCFHLSVHILLNHLALQKLSCIFSYKLEKEYPITLRGGPVWNHHFRKVSLPDKICSKS